MRMIQNTSAADAKKYFAAELSLSDYYVNDQELQGRFDGRLADRLGVTGAATKDAFYDLCENINPATGKPLTVRTKEDRTVGYDINFHCPKSVSVLHALSKDDHILKAFETSVAETMRDIEADAKTRIRKKGVYGERETGELVWAEFTHQTARPLEGQLPDPHLHAHCFVFNATWDDAEKQYKAGQFRDIKRDMPYYQARFHKKLADRLVTLGYRVERTDTAFEVEGVPKSVIQHFSKRTDEIGRIAKEKGITNAKELDALGARTRGKKLKGLSMEELRADWRRQIRELGTEKETDGTAAVRFAPKQEKETIRPERCIDHALDHCFERASVMDDRRVLAESYRHALGHHETSLDDITSAFREDQRFLHFSQGSRTISTTKTVLQEEKRMVDLARAGQGKLIPLYKEAPQFTKLVDQQADAAAHVLTTTNRVSIIRGAAGAGKTTLMQETVSKIEDTGRKVFVLAPTAEASRGVLRAEGFTEADTVAKFLADKQRHEELHGQVLWVDEAGLLGTKDMTDLLALASKYDTHLILSGDTRQHAAVVRGDALRILNTVGGIKTAEVSKIHRQKHADYRAAVEHLSEGDVKTAFEKLDGIGSIKTVDPLKPNTELVDDYIAALKRKKSALVVSPTHKQGDEVTEAIRQRLRSEKMIGKKEIKALRYTNLNFTEAEKADWRNFKEGLAVQFNQHRKGIKRGSRWSVKSVQDNTVTIENADGETAILPQDRTDSFDVFLQSEIGLSKGDKVKITRNGQDEKDKRLNNGMALEIVSVNKNGKIVLRNKESKTSYTLKDDFGHIAHAHCVTSHASQGKTVDEVFISQPSATFPATDMKQFYVSVSRGREVVHIYTDDKTALLDHASMLGDRQSALELVSQKSHTDYVSDRQRAAYSQVSKKKEPEKEIIFDNPKIDRDYEPTL